MTISNVIKLEYNMSNVRKGRYILTYKGIRFWPMDPRAEEIDIEDIAHSLSLLCRFNGHVPEFYSVAQHSVMVSKLCSPANRLWGLLHDASEAYISDMPTPIKRELPDYMAAERVVQNEVCIRFGLPLEEPPEVKEADQRLLVTEMRDFMKEGIDLNIEPLPKKIRPWSPKFAKQEFLKAFNKLTM